MVYLHNSVGSRVGVPPVVWSNRLAARAQDWANYLLARRQFFHRSNSPFGENLFEITGGHASPVQVIDAWAAEARDRDYRGNRCRGVCGH